MNMYKGLIEEHTTLSVTLKPNMGKTTFVFNALKSGEIDIYPEFTGTILATFLNEEAESTNEMDVYNQAQQGLAKKYDMTLLDPMSFNNTYALAVTSDLAKENDLEKISDLKDIEDRIKVGFTLEFADRQDGYLGIQELYNLTFDNLKTMEPKLRYFAIATGDINLLDAHSTDSELEEYNLVVLKDDKELFPPYQGAPLLLDTTLEKYPELKGVLNKLGGFVTDDEMHKMNYEVNVNNQSPQEVAFEFLKINKLIQ